VNNVLRVCPKWRSEDMFQLLQLLGISRMLTSLQGSIICATAHSSGILILGRTIQGCGSAGAFSGGLLLCAYVVPRPKLPIYLALLSSMFMVASCIGPVIGGVFASSSLTWRFCFWINIREYLIFHVMLQHTDLLF
jgi:MFS family permease